jgi:peroxiredoxin
MLKSLGTPLAVTVALTLTASTPARADSAQKAAIDKPAPDFTLTDIHGKKHTLSAYKGKYVVLEWNNWDCPFVKKHYNSKNMQKLQAQYGDKGVVWLTICSSAKGKQGYYDAKELQKRYDQSESAAAAYLTDPEGTVGRLYGAKTTPHMFVIDPDGVLIYAGAIDDKKSTNPDDVKGAVNYVQQALNASMSGKSVQTKTSTPYGCSVKYK